MKEIIKTNLLNETGVSGWMADFGEHLPLDSRLYSGENAAVFHNKFPEEWAKLNHEAIAEWRSETGTTDEIVYFMRSANLKSTLYTPLYWIGDQMVDWDQYDGLKSVLIAFLSGGIGGNSLTHSDTGGYTQFPPYIVRSKELLMRWVELSTFGSAVFRTHVGSSLSTHNYQIYSESSVTEHFAIFANIFTAFANYRMKLMKKAEKYGWPLMRPLA